MTDSANQSRLAQEKLTKTEIPVLLSKLVQEGKREAALTLLIAWGRKEKDNQTIWEEVQNLLGNTSS